jgi:hypothetical protein
MVGPLLKDWLAEFEEDATTNSSLKLPTDGSFFIFHITAVAVLRKLDKAGESQCTCKDITQ